MSENPTFPNGENKKLSCRRETARRLVIENFARSLVIIRNDTVE